MKKTIITMALVALCGQAWGRTLTPAEALNRALGSADTPARLSAMAGAATVKAAYTVSDSKTGSPLVYVINPASKGNGFLVVSADDIATPLLGYSDNGTFDPDNMPDNLRWWLSQYSEEISAAVSEGVETVPYYRASERKEIAPLVTTKWNQDAPFNNDCPLTTYNGQSVRSVTGCVATAMAQVIKYHNWPEKGIGQNSYFWGNKTLSFDYANTTFDWANMIDVYNASATEAQKAAVAELMYACGVSVNMSYSADASGAQSQYVPYAMREFFNFDKGVTTASRYSYSLAGWEDLIYNELATNGPVYYSGSNESVGHAFVCDGYANGYFHFNWGWGGLSDGYFRLNALDPETQGIGGSTSGYNMRQAVIVGCKKPQADSRLAPPNLILLNPMNAYKSGNNLMVTGTFWNYSPYELEKGRMALRVVNAETGEFVRYLQTQSYTPFPIARGRFNFVVNPNGLPEGTYRCYVGYLKDDVFTAVHPCLGDTGYVKIVKTASSYTFEMGRVGKFVVTSVEPLSPFYIGQIYGLKINYTYDSDESGFIELIPELCNASGMQVARSALLPTDINPGEGSITYEGIFSGIQPGSYNLSLLRNMGNNENDNLSYEFVCDMIPVEVAKAPTTPTIVTARTWEVVDAGNVDPSNLCINASVQCVMGYYAGSLNARISDEAGNVVTTISSPYLFIEGGDKFDASIKGELVGAVSGKTYSVRLYLDNGSAATNDTKTFTVGDSSAITDIDADSAEHPVEYFNLQGVRVENPSNGLFIRRQGNKVEKVYIR